MKLKIRRSILCLGDTHFGSPYAIWPESFQVPDTDYAIVASPGQCQILEYWEDMQRHADMYGVDTVVLTGDLIDGNNRKAYGRERMTADLDIQSMVGVSMLAPVCKGRKVVGVRGTDYHSSREVNAERYIIDALGGVYGGRLRNYKLTGTPVTVNVSHGEGGSLIYRATKADRELLFLLAAEAAKKINFHVDLMIRGHLHYFGYLDQGINRYLSVPCWCDWIPYRPALRLYGRQPDIGWVILLVTEDGDIMVRRKLYPLPNTAQKEHDV